MKIIPLAFESFGTRSMATYIQGRGCKVLIDPGVSLAPSRFGLPPHRLELRRMDEHWRKIKKYAEKADVLIITHYHYDHHEPTEPDIYKGKIALIKHPEEKINLSQKRRARFFLEILGDLPEKIEHSDGKEFRFEGTMIKFSNAVPHGTNVRLGYVTEVCIESDGKKLIHTSDVEGPSLEEQVSFLIDENPDVIFLDGPMTYMLGYRYSKASLQASIENILKVIEKTRVKQIVFDHHLLRDLKWQKHIEDIYKAGEESGTKILTAAEFAGRKNDLLEARRKEIYDPGEE